MNNSSDKQPAGNWKRWIIYVLMLFVGFSLGGAASVYFLHSSPVRIDFARDRPPTLMMHPLGRDGAYIHEIGNWQLLSSLTSGNDSLVLKYRDTFIASFTTTPDRSLESMIVNHPLHDTVLLILEELNNKTQPGKVTTDILTNDGKKIGFVIDENMDGQPDLRFEYGGPYLYVWLDQSWHRVLRISPRQTGQAFKHTVMYQQKMHQIHLEQYPYQLEPLQAGE